MRKQPRMTVEECLKLNVGDLRRTGLFRQEQISDEYKAVSGEISSIARELEMEINNKIASNERS